MLVSHSPDVSARLPAEAPTIVFAGHTHCGQVRLPLIGALANPSPLGARYLCGVVREGRRTTIVTAGLGTSVLPVRLGAPPDLWLVRFGP